jgi:hypothetical protein
MSHWSNPKWAPHYLKSATPTNAWRLASTKSQGEAWCVLWRVTQIFCKTPHDSTHRQSRRSKLIQAIRHLNGMTQIFREGTHSFRGIAGGGARTHTILRSLDFESSASASSATPALRTEAKEYELRSQARSRCQQDRDICFRLPRRQDRLSCDRVRFRWRLDRRWRLAWRAFVGFKRRWLRDLRYRSFGFVSRRQLTRQAHFPWQIGRTRGQWRKRRHMWQDHRLLISRPRPNWRRWF